MSAFVAVKEVSWSDAPILLMAITITVTLKDTDTMTLQDALYYQNVDYILTIRFLFFKLKNRSIVSFGK